MAYTKTTWKDRAVEYPRRFTKASETSNEVTLVPSPGIVTEEGTAISASLLNKMEKGIKDAHDANLGLATTAQAQAGIANDKYMTPQTTMAAIDSKTNFGTATVESGNEEFTLTLSGHIPSTLPAGYDIAVKFDVVPGESPDVTITNGTVTVGPIGLFETTTKRIRNIKTDKIYKFIYDGSSFYLVSGGGNELNVFAQSALPADKFEGICIKSDLAISKVVTDSGWFTAGSFNPDTTIATTSEATLAIAVGKNLFYFYGNNVYRLNKDTKVNSLFATFSTNGTFYGVLADGLDIYVLRYENGQQKLYKLNSTNSNITFLTNGGSDAAGGIAKYLNKIVIFSKGGGATSVFEYDIVSLSRTSVATITYSTMTTIFRVVYRQQHVFLIGHGTPSSYAYYNMSTKVSSAFSITNGVNSNSDYIAVAVVDDYLYLSFEGNDNLYRLNIATISSSYTATIISNPASLTTGFRTLSYIDNELWLISNKQSGQANVIHRYMLTDKTYDAKTVVIKRSNQLTGTHQTQLINNEDLTGTNNRLLTGFDDVAYYNGTNLLTSLETYVGTGSAWTRIK